MEQNNIVVMIDDEITRLREVQQILQTLLPVEAAMAPVVEAHSVEEAQAEAAQIPATIESVTVKRSVSRRGIATGRRGPRRAMQAPQPRAVDAAIPKQPVVVARAPVVAKPATPAAQPAEGTLEAWVRSLRPSGQPA